MATLANLGKRAAVHITRAAKKHGGLSIFRPLKGGAWIVRVDSKGKLSVEGQAAAHYGANTSIAALIKVDLLALLNEAQRLNSGPVAVLTSQAASS